MTNVIEKRSFLLAVRQEGEEEEESEDIRIRGWAAKYNQPFQLWGSLYEDVAPNAFKESLERLEKEERTLKMFYNHDRSPVIGIWDEYNSKRKGLEVSGTIRAGVTDTGDEVVKLVSNELVDSLSIGFRIIEEEFVSTDDDSYLRIITKADLVEVSVVSIPASPTALITDVKRSWGYDGDENIEKLLRAKAKLGVDIRDVAPKNDWDRNDPYEVLGRFI